MSKLPWPERRYDKVYLRMPDGSEIELSPLDVFMQIEAWSRVVGVLACYQAINVNPELKERAGQ